MAKKLQEFKDNVSRNTFGMTRAEAVEQNICVKCRQGATWYSEAGRREYLISGICEPCFDSLFPEE